MNPISHFPAVVRDIVWRSTRHWLSAIGAFVALVAGLAFLAIFALSLTGVTLGPYTGVISFLIVPALFVFGLALIPVGLFLLRRREAKSQKATFPVIDLNEPRTRTIALVVVLFTTMNVMVLSTATYKGLDVLHSDQFCGGTCHSVMAPEEVAHLTSPHAGVYCADCHVGEGAGHWTKSKMRGVTQMIQFVTNDIQRPAKQPTEVEMVVCTRCHMAKRFTDDRLHIRKKFSDDEQTVEKTTVWRVLIGGYRDGKWSGVHSHNSMSIRYLSDKTRENINEVEVTRLDGSKSTYKAKEPKAIANAQWYEMSCTDCHNRPGHNFRNPEEIVDGALGRGAIDKELPFIRKNALAILKTDYPNADAAKKGIVEQVNKIYAQKTAGPDAKKIEELGQFLSSQWTSNVFPQMNVKWGTYRNYLGHEPGCYRCHDKQHADDKGKVIQQKCSGTCHDVIADEEEKPEVMDVLFP